MQPETRRQPKQEPRLTTIESGCIPLLALAIAWSLGTTGRALAHRCGAIDNVNPRKIHAKATPRFGGIALLPAILIGVWLTSTLSTDNVTVPYQLSLIAAGSVIVASQDIEGVQAFGAIQDPSAGYVAVPFYPKSWIQDDPGQRFLMTQSAPLVVPLRPNGSVAATV